MTAMLLAPEQRRGRLWIKTGQVFYSLGPLLMAGKSPGLVFLTFFAVLSGIDF